MKTIIFYALGALLIVGSSAVPVLLSQSFQGNDFKGPDGWNVIKGAPTENVCSGTRIFGGFRAIGRDGSLLKVFQTPPHSQVQIKVQLWKLATWDNEEFHLWVDDQRVFQKAFPWRETGKNSCGAGNMDEVINIDVTLKHTGTTAVVVLTSTLDEAADNEAWGIRDFQILVEKCPDGCSACILGETFDQCKVWDVAKNFWGALEVDKIGAEGWSVAGGPVKSTNCGGLSMFGGFDQWGKGAEIKGVVQLKPHYRLKVKFLFNKIDSWDNEIASFKIDGQEAWKRGFAVNEGYFTAVCNFQHDWRQLFTRVEVESAHTADKAEFYLSTTLNQAPNDEAWGIRDFFVFIAQCPAFCNKCKGASDCQECAPNYVLKGGLCVEAQNFIQVESSFFDNVFAGLNDWVLSGNKEGRLVSECGGKYLVGGFNVLGKGGVAQKNYKLPGHKRIKIQLNLYKIDSWDNEFMYIKVDGVEVWKQQWTVQTGGGNLCGQGVWNDHIQYVEQIYAHTSVNLNIQLTSNLDEDPENESWGFRDFKLFIEPREECAVLFTQANFEGTPFSLCSATANFAEDRIPSQIKSVKVPPQGKVTLYSNSDYFGKKFIFTEDTPEITEEMYSFAEVEKRWIEAEEI